jgi:hypothetical protein
MNITHVFLLSIALMIVWLCIGLYWGYHYAIQHHKIESVESIKSYIKDNFATEWDAYQLGYAEGYTQGNKDGRDPPL